MLVYVLAMFFVPLLPSPVPPLELLTLSIHCVNFKVHLSIDGLP